MITVNLIEPSVVHARRRGRRLRRWGWVFAVAAMAGAIPVGLELSRHQEVIALARTKRQIENDILQARNTVNEQAGQISSLNSQIARSNALRSKRSWSRLLVMLARALPDEMWLVNVATDPGRPRNGNVDLTSAKSKGTKVANKNKSNDEESKVVTLLAPNSLAIEGYANEHRELYDFLSHLKQTDVFSEMSLTKATEEPVLNGTAIRFRIQCQW